jgi:hypothetical protein
MCELQKLIHHQAGLRTVSTYHDWCDSNDTDSEMSTLCVDNVDDLYHVLQRSSTAQRRCVSNDSIYYQ